MVDRVRVTHPCATRHQEQALMLPFDLHVLSLPLAFILSQDQTLHSKLSSIQYSEEYYICYLIVAIKIDLLNQYNYLMYSS